MSSKAQTRPLEGLHRTRTDHSAENFSVLRHIALNLLKVEKRVKVGVKGKRLKCGWGHDYLLKASLALYQFRCVCPGLRDIILD